MPWAGIAGPVASFLAGETVGFCTDAHAGPLCVSAFPRPVRSNGPETHAKQHALSYAFDLWRVFQQCCQGIAATFCSKSSRGGSFWIVDTGTSSGTYIVLKNHCFSTPNASFQNRSFSGLMTP